MMMELFFFIAQAQIPSRRTIVGGQRGALFSHLCVF